MSKMGISTIRLLRRADSSRRSGSAGVVERYFTGTASRIGGIGIRDSPRVARTHGRAYPGKADALLPVIGLYAWRRDGEHHHWNPDTISSLQHAVRSGSARPTRSTRDS